jgi:hypothetical protein
MRLCAVHVSNTGSAWQYIMMNFTLQESEGLRTSNREEASAGQARFDVAAMLAEDSGLHVATLWQCASGCRPFRGSAVLRNFGSYSSAARSHIQADFNPKVFTALASAGLNVEPLTLTWLTVDVLHFEICFTFLCHLLTACTYVQRLSCESIGFFLS